MNCRICGRSLSTEESVDETVCTISEQEAFENPVVVGALPKPSEILTDYAKAVYIFGAHKLQVLEAAGLTVVGIERLKRLERLS